MLNNINSPVLVEIPLKRKSSDILPNGKVFKNDKFAALIKDKVVCKAREDAGVHESEYQDAYDSVIGIVTSFNRRDDNDKIVVSVSLYNTLEYYKCKNPELNLIGKCIETDDTVELVEVQRIELWDKENNRV